ncbi:MAG: DUF6882 domain-containing protein [Nitrospirota bacterium]
MNNMIPYLEQYALLSLEKRDKLTLLVGEHLNELDPDAGMIRFNSFEFPFQVLGTESDNTITWLWAWADEQTEISRRLTEASLALRTWGNDKGIPEFNNPSVDLTKMDGFLCSLIATEVCKASSFYRDAYEGGALYILLYDKRIDMQPSFDLTRLSNRFWELVSRYELNQRNVLRSYLTMKHLSPLEGISRIACTLETGELLTAEFDQNDRLEILNGEPLEL